MDCMQETAHIVYGSDDRFAPIMGVSIVSLLSNSQDLNDIIVYILECDISEINKKKIERVFIEYGRKAPIWIPAKDISKELAMNIAFDRGSLSQYANLFIASVLPEGLTRVLYLDCDTIVRQSVSELWRLDMHGKTIAALMDAFSKHYRKNIGLKPNDIIFNAGIMLIDLVRWREQNIEEQLLKFIVAKNGRVQQADQGVLNAILSNDVFCFEPRFNAVTNFFDFTYKDMLVYRKPPEYYSEVLVKEAVENPAIIHFTTSFLSKRAWVKGCQHKYVDLWLQLKEKSPWKEEELWEDMRPRWKQNISAIYKMLPRGLAIRIAGLFQAYVRPFVNHFRM